MIFSLKNHSPYSSNHLPAHLNNLPYSSPSELSSLLTTADDSGSNGVLFPRPFYLNTDQALYPNGLTSTGNSNSNENSNRLGNLVSRINDRLTGWIMG